MKKFGVSTDWLAKRSNSLRQSSYSRSSVKSNTSKLDAMIKSASTKPIRSNRKLSFIEPIITTKIEIDKENTDPSIEINEKKEELSKTTTYDLSSEIDEDKEKDLELSPTSKEFSLRIPRVNLPEDEKNQLNSSTSSSNDEKPKLKKKRKNRKSSPKQNVDEKQKSPEKKDKNNQEQGRIEHLKKLLRISGIKIIMKKTELDHLSSNKAKIKYLKSLFHTAGFTGNLSIKECEKFRKKRDTEKELLEIQANSVDVQGHVKGGRTLRGQGRKIDELDIIPKRKRTASSEIENNNNSSDEEYDNKIKKPIIKKRRIFKMEASPEVSEEE